MSKIASLVFIMVFMLVSISGVSAQLLDKSVGDDMKNEMKDAGRGNYNTSGGENNFLLSQAAGTIVTAFLGLLGIIFLVMIIIGGFNWMTAAGSEDKVTKAKQTITRGVIGLIITVSAYAISAFVFRALGPVLGV